MVKIAALLLASATADQFADWKEQFGKVYNGDESYRRAIFESNLELIATENAKGHTYTLGLGPFTDLTSEEYKANLGFEAPADDDLPTFVTEDLTEDAELADSVDWTTKGAVTPVKNQGQCGSCWAFSTTGALEGAYQVASGKLVSLSEQQYVDCDGFPNMGCNGGNMAFGLRYAKDHNICTEESYQYKGKGGACQAASCTTGLKSGTVTGVTKVGGPFGAATDNALKSALNKQPISIGIEADQPAFQHYVSGVVTGTCGAKVDHGVLLVGYGTDGSSPYWKVKNSWGATWGDHGFVRLVQGKNQCGINTQPNYPVIKSSVSV